MRSSGPGISMYVVPASVQRTVKAINQIEQQFEKAIARVIQEAGINIQRDAKANAPVDFGVLRASVYIDYRKSAIYKAKNAPADRIRQGAKTMVPYRSGESEKSGLNAFIGSDLNYAAAQDNKTNFLSDAYNKWNPKVKPAIDKAIKEEIKKSTLR